MNRHALTMCDRSTMFDEAKTDLIDALQTNDAALAYADAKDAISAGDLVAEQTITEHAVIEYHEGAKYVVAVADETDEYPIVDGADDAEADAEPADAEEDDDPAADDEPAESATQDDEPVVSDPDEEDVEIFRLNGLRIGIEAEGVTPESMLAGTPTDEDVYGATVLTNDHEAIPQTRVPYIPVDLGERDTEEVFYRLQSLAIPAILEGEAGTGKNQLVRSACARLNRPTRRQEFGASTSIFDVVGEKEFDDEGTYYILGDLAVSMIFGHCYIADEINMATGDVTSYLHPAFEDAGKRELKLRGTGIVLRDLPVTADEEAEHGSWLAAARAKWDPEKHLGKFVHPEFRAVGTCNPLEYADTKEMNDALRDRCVVIEHPYLAESEQDEDGIEAEAGLAASVTGCDPEDATPLVRMAAVLREARKKGSEHSTPIGFRPIRDTIELAGANEEFMSFAAAARIKFVGQAAKKGDRQYILDTVEEEI